VAGFKSERWPASDRNRWPASYWNPWPASSVSAQCRYGAHYGIGILPARPRKPRDKAKVEAAVLIVERWLLGRLRR
jgi:hypothetical protein